MGFFFWIAVIVLGIGGYSWYRNYQDRLLTQRLKTMRDTDQILGEIDAATAQIKAEGDFWQRNNRRW